MDISNCYSNKLNKISNHLADLERGYTHEFTRTPGTPSCATLSKHLKENISSLLDLVENDKPVMSKKIAEVSKNI